MSKESILCIEKIIDLRDKNKLMTKEKDCWLLDYLETYPIIDAAKTNKRLYMDYSKVNRTISRFVNLGILIIENESKKKRTYVYVKYMNILKN